MLQQNFYPSRIIQVVPSDTIDIPNPSALTISGTTTGVTANKLVDTSEDFTVAAGNPIAIGDIVFNTTDITIATVTAIDSATVLSISANIMAAAEDYSIYRKDRNTGCLIWVSGIDRNSNSIAGISAGRDPFTTALSPVYGSVAVQGDTVLPFQALRINATDTSLSVGGRIYALFN